MCISSIESLEGFEDYLNHEANPYDPVTQFDAFYEWLKGAEKAQELKWKNQYH